MNSSAKEVSKLRKINRYFLDDAEKYLTDARNTLDDYCFQKRECNRIQSSHAVNEDINESSENEPRPLNGMHQSRYDSWQRRNSSSLLQKSTRLNEKSPQNNLTKHMNGQASNIRKPTKVKKLLVSDKIYIENKQEGKQQKYPSHHVANRRCYCNKDVGSYTDEKKTNTRLSETKNSEQVNLERNSYKNKINTREIEDDIQSYNDKKTNRGPIRTRNGEQVGTENYNGESRRHSETRDREPDSPAIIFKCRKKKDADEIRKDKLAARSEYDSTVGTSIYLQSDNTLKRMTPKEIDSIRKFRDKYYFECHSSTTRSKDRKFECKLKTSFKPTVSKLKKQKCQCCCSFQFNDDENERLSSASDLNNFESNVKCTCCCKNLSKGRQYNVDNFSTRNNYNSDSDSIDDSDLSETHHGKDSKDDIPKCIVKIPEFCVHFPLTKSMVMLEQKVEKHRDSIMKGSSKKKPHEGESMSLRFQRGFRIFH